MLRRGYNFTDGSDGFGHLDAGLFFIAFVRSPATQLHPGAGADVQRRAQRVHLPHRHSRFRMPAGPAARVIRRPTGVRRSSAERYCVENVNHAGKVRESVRWNSPFRRLGGELLGRLGDVFGRRLGNVDRGRFRHLDRARLRDLDRCRLRNVGRRRFGDSVGRPARCPRPRTANRPATPPRRSPRASPRRVPPAHPHHGGQPR